MPANRLQALRTQDRPPRARQEADLDEERHDVALRDRLAVEALNREALQASCADLFDERGQRRAEPVLVRIAERDKRAAATLDEERRLAAEQDDLRAGNTSGSSARAW